METRSDHLEPEEADAETSPTIDLFHPNYRTRFELICLVIILLLACYLRLVNVTDNPGWYTDEGTHLDIAQNYLAGKVQYLAVNQSTLLFGKLPLFELLLAGFLGLFDGGMATLRVFTATLGIVSVGLLYEAVRRTQNGDALLALLAALMYAIYPQAVLYSRFGFSYNLLVPLMLLTYLGLAEYLKAPQHSQARPGWLLLAALSTGLGGISGLWMFVLAVPIVLVISTRNWRDLWWAILLILLPFGLYSALMLLTVPDAFLFDLRYMQHQVSRLTLLEQIRSLGLNYTTLLSQDIWITLAIIGLFLLRPVRLRRLSLLLFLFPIIILGRTVALYNLSFYYMIPLLPFAGLGLAALIKTSGPFVARTIYRGLAALLDSWSWLPQHPWRQEAQHWGLSAITAILGLFIIVTPFLMSLITTIDQVRNGITTEIDPFLLNPNDTRQAVDFVNQRTDTDDVIIASPGLAWLLQANAADFQMSAAVTGQETVHLPPAMPADRFAFNPHYQQAHYVVVDNLWHNWAVWHIADVPEMMNRLESWPLVFKAGQIAVYENPDL